MKSGWKLIGLWILFMLITLACCVACYITPESKNQEDVFVKEREGASITFIMGEDKPGKSYYTDATEHFTFSSKEKTDFVVSTCRTIECIIEYINDNEQEIPWATINVVAHGNPQTGLNLWLSQEGHKATPKRMVQELLLDSLPKFDVRKVDSLTHLNIWSCGIGKSPLINFALPKIFNNKEGISPKVYCSPYFVIFSPNEEGDIVRLNASYWPYYFKRGYRPSPSEIASELDQQYPEANRDWEDALQAPAKQKKTMDYHIPISYTQFYDNKDDRPDLSTVAKQQDYIDSIPTVLDQIQESGIPRDRFNWKVEKRIIKDASGANQYAVKVLGMATVLCFLEMEEV